jgi:hypothetical protein
MHCIVQQQHPSQASIYCFRGLYTFLVARSSSRQQAAAAGSSNHCARVLPALSSVSTGTSDPPPHLLQSRKHPLIALTFPMLRAVAAGVWAEQRADDGRRYYWNKFTNTSKWELSEEEKVHLVPNLDPYDNPMVLPLQVRTPAQLFV